MTSERATDRSSKPPYNGQQHQYLMNRRQALQSLGLDWLVYRAIHEKIPFGWDRVITGLICLELLKAAGVFGEQSDEDFLIQLSKEWRFPIAGTRYSDWPGRDLRESIPSQSQVSFARAAAFLDLTSEWINCDDLHMYLERVLKNENKRHWDSNNVTMRGGNITTNDGAKLWAVTTLLKLQHVAGFGEANTRGFNKYLDLSTDLRIFMSEQDETTEWFRKCFGPWFASPFIERTLALVSLHFRRPEARFEGFHMGTYYRNRSTHQEWVGALMQLNFYAINDLSDFRHSLKQAPPLASKDSA